MVAATAAPAAAISQPESQRQVRQQRVDVDALYELVARGNSDGAPQVGRDGRRRLRKPR